MKIVSHANTFLCLFLLSASFVFSQQRNISGSVTDDQGVPLPGATIIVQETNSGTTSDFDGNYTISAEDGQTLIISYVGYTSQQITVSNSSSYDVALKLGNALDEVVVTSLGIKRQKRELTYATQNVDSEGIDESRPNGNLVNSLQGKVAGISIQTTSQGVSSASKVVLRGNRSIAGSSQPLYIVDGVPLGGDITDLSPDDIASISVLRGSNAAAIYGARANNGAIIITTKSGEAGAFSVNVNSTLTMETANILFDYQNEYGQGSGGVFSSFSTDSWGPKLGGAQAHWSFSPDIAGAIPYVANPDNVMDFFNTGMSLANNISVTSGSEKMTTYFGYTNDIRTGIVPGNELERHNINLKIDNNMLDGKLKLSSRVNYIKSTIDNQLAQWESFDNPLRHAYRLPRNIRTQDAEVFEFVDSSGNVKQNYWKPNDNGGANPYWTINRNLNEVLTDRVLGYTSLTYQFNDDLSLLVRSSIDNTNFTRESKFYNDSYIIADNGNYQTSNTRSLEWNNDFLLTYDKDLSDDLSLNLNIGGNNRVNKSKGVNTNNGGLNAPNIFALSNAQNLTASQFISEREVNSLYGFGNLGFKNALFVDLTYRSDWSSTLPVENNRYDYYSAGLSAVISDFITMPSFIDFLKLRGSLAEVGNDTNPYSLERLANLESGGFISLQTTAPASDLRPEKTTSFELGFDTTFFNQRVNLDFTYYKSNSIDQLFRQDVPQASGVTSKFINGGDIQNEGIEAVLSVGLLTNTDFKWDVTFNYAANRSEVIRLAEGLDALSYGGDFMRRYQLDVGMPWGSIYSRGFERDAQGRVLMNANGTPVITSGQSVNIGNFNPDWLGGILNSFSYKNFNFRFLIDIRQGGEVVSFTKTLLASDGLLAETAIGRQGGIRFGTDVYTNETPASSPTAVDPETFWTSIGGRNSPAGEAFVEDASNIRLREMSLSYGFGQSSLQNTPFENIKLSLVGRNLFFLSNNASIDPEAIHGTATANDGYEAFSLPTTRSIGLNLKLGF
ncbi:MAG: SusC/RagA family TonB-linked outer membrane protein [Flavobacteriaceae bacterium]